MCCSYLTYRSSSVVTLIHAEALQSGAFKPVVKDTLNILEKMKFLLTTLVCLCKEIRINASAFFLFQRSGLAYYRLEMVSLLLLTPVLPIKVLKIAPKIREASTSCLIWIRCGKAG